jgi:predicted transcriptional regulator
MTSRQQLFDALSELPEDATIDDAIKQLLLLKRIKEGVDDAKAGRTVSQEEARERMARWLR